MKRLQDPKRSPFALMITMTQITENLHQHIDKSVSSPASVLTNISAESSARHNHHDKVTQLNNICKLVEGWKVTKTSKILI